MRALDFEKTTKKSKKQIIKPPNCSPSIQKHQKSGSYNYNQKSKIKICGNSNTILRNISHQKNIKIRQEKFCAEQQIWWAVILRMVKKLEQFLQCLKNLGNSDFLNLLSQEYEGKLNGVILNRKKIETIGKLSIDGCLWEERSFIVDSNCSGLL